MKSAALNNQILSIKLSVLLAFIVCSGCNNTSDLDSSIQSSASKDNHKSALTQPKVPTIDMHTAVISDDMEAIKQHILTGSDLNIKDPFGGSSPLITAALFDKKTMVAVLLDAGVELDFQNNDGSTALHTAAFFCRPAIVQLLLEQGADKTLKNNTGATAYEMVAGPFDEVKPIYDIIGQSLAPFGLVLDYGQLKATRPEIADLLK